MSDLRRELAPVSAGAWQEIEEEAREVLNLRLAARKLVDFDGPLGWSASAVDLGRAKPIRGHAKGTEVRLRQTLQLIEVRVPFTLSREEIEAIDRGADDVDLDAARDAAATLAGIEDGAVFNGYKEAGIEGIADASAKSKLTLSADYTKYPDTVVAGLAQMKAEGVEGPFALALGPRCWEGLHRTTTRSGFPVIDHVRQLLDGPLIWAPAVDGAVLVSQRGGDFKLTVGRDISIGYFGHDRDSVELYLVESFTFRDLAPEAAVPFVYK
ncbi:MAG: family 1 encapsulin nanocompartment shell protein [Alphaproteobacteria bacterium]